MPNLVVTWKINIDAEEERIDEEEEEEDDDFE